MIFFLVLNKAIEKFLSYGDKKIKEDGLEDLDVTFLEVLADMLKGIKSKMMNYAEPIMLLGKNILASKVRKSILTNIFAIAFIILCFFYLLTFN